MSQSPEFYITIHPGDTVVRQVCFNYRSDEVQKFKVINALQIPNFTYGMTLEDIDNSLNHEILMTTHLSPTDLRQPPQIRIPSSIVCDESITTYRVY